MSRDTLRILLICSTVTAAALSFLFGVPRLRAWSTPRLERVWVVSAVLGDDMASAAAREVVAGVPVNLYAVVETTHRGQRRFFGPLERMRLGAEGAEEVEVAPWSGWWNSLEILWFKVEPVFGFDNVDFEDSFAADDIAYRETFMLAWGFRDQHAADITATGDDYPRVEVGTMRFKAQAVVRDFDERILDEATAPGPEAVHAGAVADRPHRVTIRAAHTALGALQGYSGLPYVPQRAGLAVEAHPATRFIGGTILDFWIAARRWLGDDGAAFLEWTELAEQAQIIVPEMFRGDDGTYYYTADPQRRVTFDEVAPGDLLSIEDHIGVLYQDRGLGGAGDGILNGADRILGGYFEPLRDMPLEEAFLSGVTVYRLPAATGGR